MPPVSMPPDSQPPVSASASESTGIDRRDFLKTVGAAVLAAVRDLTFMTGAVLAVDGGRPLS